MQHGTFEWSIFIPSRETDNCRYKQFSVEEALVYSYIESSGREGIWTRTVRARTNLHPTTFNRCIKTLESKGFIKSIQSAKHPNRKTYILAHLQPSDDITGGPFYTDGKLDEEFVHQLALWSERYILGRSWWYPTSQGVGEKREKSTLNVAQLEDLKAHESHGKEARRQRSKKPVPMPSGYTGYPTIPEITKAVNESKLSGVVMKEIEMQQLMDILCWDGRIMKVMNGKAYKAIRLSGKEDDAEFVNGLTESPCGRCPVFDLCEEGGPVNARSCTYFQEWLAI